MSYKDLEKIFIDGYESNKDKFPSSGGDYKQRYELMKSHMTSHVYKWIGAVSSAIESNVVYTDHSINHFNSVIKYAGKLLDVENAKIAISPYEIFLLLTSILLHDAGMIYGRYKHESRTIDIINNLGNAASPDQFEKSIVSKIARAHGGKVKTSNGWNKDTISVLEENEPHFGGITYRPQLIAAIVRFADEISEDRSRTFLSGDSSEQLGSSQIYHEYAGSVSSVLVDIQGKCIKIKYGILIRKLRTQFSKDASNQFLIDEIASRLQKMYLEMIYCRKFMFDIVHLNSIKATIDFYDDDDQQLDNFSKTIVLEEKGYPENGLKICDIYPNFTGKYYSEQSFN